MFQNRDHKWAYFFTEADGKNNSLFGGKGAGLAEMTHAGLPVPPGFVITTEACNSYSDYDKQFPEGMWTQTREQLSKIEQSVGKIFGDADNPLLVSVRSGAAISMPGMMDTVLNLGLNDQTVQGLAACTGDERFAFDAYRRFVSMFGDIVMGVHKDRFDRVLEHALAQTPNHRDTELTVEQLKNIIFSYKRIIFAERHGQEFPEDPHEQLRMAISSVFDSWMGRRAIDYRRIHQIPDTLGTAVTVQAMVFGNMGETSATGVAFTRNPSTGEDKLFGEFLINAQGEDVVAGTRTPLHIDSLQDTLPAAYAQFVECAKQLERHYSDMQDIEFTIENNKLWLLQTRSGKRTGAAAVKIATEMECENLIDYKQAVRSVSPDHINQLLHPTIDPSAEATVLTIGLPASPGAAQGQVVFDPDVAEELAAQGKQLILVRHETSPDDFHGMVASNAILTARGGMTSHAAVVARGMGKPCIVGAGELRIDYAKQLVVIGERTIRNGDWITLDGSTGRVLLGKIPTIQPILDENFNQLMQWSDKIRTLNVRTNADTPHDAEIGRKFGAEGIGLCRTEHMFFGEERLAAMREMILAENAGAREKALDKLLPFQREDFAGIFRAMDGLPVTIRLLDPPLHEFLPAYNDLIAEIAELKVALQHPQSIQGMDGNLDEIFEKRRLLKQVEHLREINPMLGLRGCRLGIIHPEVTRMQVRAIFEAACQVQSEGIKVLPEVMVPLISTSEELKNQKDLIKTIAQKVMDSLGTTVIYSIGTMIELPRAALTAGKIAEVAEFFSFGTNDLTQTTFGLSRDDSGSFLPHYVIHKLMADDPFQTLDREGVGELVQIAAERGRKTNPNLKLGICGEHGGDPRSIAFCHEIGLNYVSCSPFRVPVARLAAAHAALKDNSTNTEE